MPSTFLNLFKAQASVEASSEPPPLRDVASETIGLLSTPELNGVLQQCRSQVARIAKRCKARNLRYRDPDFDVENAKDKCLNGLDITDVFNPSDVQRVTELFENPQFFVDGPYSNEAIQGQNCSNCWFISALAATSTVKGLVEKYCVARDEEVGVYGFVFWRDMRWVSVVVDDLLYTSIPKYEELSLAEKALFQNEKDRYNASARKGTKVLYFGKSGSAGETWVPLVEKAYAKLHGDYGSLYGGYTSEGVEDLTGGVSSFIQCKDILSKDDFWNNELVHANQDRVFSCAFQCLSPTRNGNFNATINGLWGNHAYSVLRTAEYTGKSGIKKRFLVLRNPHGHAEWNGPWSDGSKEWTPEWMEALPILGHVFGDPGKFIMEYKDFLSCFEQVDRTRLFDSSWTMKYEVIRVRSRPFPDSGFGYGDLCFSFSLSKTAFTILVLSQLDVRYYKGVSSPQCYWYFDFVLFKRGQKEPLDTSPHSRCSSRSVSLEFPELESGEYIIHCRLDKVPLTDFTNSDDWSQSKLARVITERAISESVATNVAAEFLEKNLPIPLDILAGQDLADLQRKAEDLKTLRRKDIGKLDFKSNPINLEEQNTTTTITTTTVVRGPTKVTTDTKEIVLSGPQPVTTPVRNGDDATPKDSVPEEESRSDDGSPFF
ncbi:hypothetical protein C8R47DRAFT_1203667, partial [Mycena vitilis]